LVEQRTENPRVGGSIPSLGTILFNGLEDFCSTGFACEQPLSNQR
jgi:hypothetical protein